MKKDVLKGLDLFENRLRNKKTICWIFFITIITIVLIYGLAATSFRYLFSWDFFHSNIGVGLCLLFGFATILSLIITILVFQKVSEPIESVEELIVKAIPEIKAADKLRILCIAPSLGQTKVKKEVWEKYKKVIIDTIKKKEVTFELINSQNDNILKFYQDMLKDMKVEDYKRFGYPIRGESLAMQKYRMVKDICDEAKEFYEDIEAVIFKDGEFKKDKHQFCIKEEYQSKKKFEMPGNGMPEFTIIDVDEKVFVVLNTKVYDFKGFVVKNRNERIIIQAMFDIFREEFSRKVSKCELHPPLEQLKDIYNKIA